MKNLNDLLAAARQAPPEKVSAETREDFARLVVAQNKHKLNSPTPDALQLWRRTGLWSLGAATAVVIAIAAFRPAPVPVATVGNPFDVVFDQRETPPLF